MKLSQEAGYIQSVNYRVGVFWLVGQQLQHLGLSVALQYLRYLDYLWAVHCHQQTYNQIHIQNLQRMFHR